MAAVRDPVCGMLVEPDDPIVRRYRNSTYRFCSTACLERFDHDPHLFVGASGRTDDPRRDPAP